MLRQGAGAPSVATINQGYPTNNRKAAGDIEQHGGVGAHDDWTQEDQ